ncbi:hypothetical protein GPSY_3212 [Paraglaciecola psychrophila 170]|nr:hypothetical protein GPSY_3212 [Paraglaciecola psychrophila 170]
MEDGVGILDILKSKMNLLTAGIGLEKSHGHWLNAHPSQRLMRL